MEIPVMGASGKSRLFQSLLWSSHCMYMYVYYNCCYTTHCNAAASSNSPPKHIQWPTLFSQALGVCQLLSTVQKSCVGYRLILLYRILQVTIGKSPIPVTLLPYKNYYICNTGTNSNCHRLVTQSLL